ncbi:helix-turn-helix domain-containing protein [Cupriavidus sp. CP313]
MHDMPSGVFPNETCVCSKCLSAALANAKTIIIVPGWRGFEADVPPEFCRALRKASKRGARVMPICTGAFVLATVGLLNGKRATVHWRHAAALAARYPHAVRATLDEGWSIVRMAKQTAMSVRTFQRHFVSTMGMPPGEWLLTERLGRARTLLEEADLSVDEIAVQVGFGAAATLRNHFRTRLGTSPGYYRRGRCQLADSEARQWQGSLIRRQLTDFGPLQ